MTVASELVKKITAGFEAGGYLFLLLLQTLITRLITATKRVQKRNNNSQVTYIGITSLGRGRQQKILTPSGMRKQPPPFMVTPTGILSDSIDSIPHLSTFVNTFSNTASLRFLRKESHGKSYKKKRRISNENHHRSENRQAKIFLRKNRTRDQ